MNDRLADSSTIVSRCRIISERFRGLSLIHFPFQPTFHFWND